MHLPHTLTLASLWLPCLLAGSSPSRAESVAVWIGCRPPDESGRPGIYHAVLDTASGKLSEPELAWEIRGAGFLTLRADGQRMYTLCRLGEQDRDGVAALEVSADAPRLRLLNTQPIESSGAAHITIDPSGTTLFTAQYGAGTVAQFPLDESGRIQPQSALFTHAGRGPNPQRQEAAHPHWVGTDPTGRWLLVPDLGIDRVVVYGNEDGVWRRVGEGHCPPGSGPRHLRFSPDARYVLVLNELQPSVTVFAWNEASGQLTAERTVPSLPADPPSVESYASELQFHPGGRHVYAANRGDDSISIFQWNGGMLTRMAREPARVRWPRHFNLDPSGRWLLAAGERSDSIAVFAVHADTGGLQYTGQTLSCPQPVCILFQKDR